MVQLRFYTTLGCHLCEQAEELLRAQQAISGLEWEAVEIADSDRLVEAYGLRIPVLQRVSDADELGWPFTEAELHRWLCGAAVQWPGDPKE
jgi:hypothetical protein